MNYWRLALVVSFSAFAVSSLALSAALSLAFPEMWRRIARFAPRDRALALWQLRLAPAGAALAFAFGFVLPTFLAFEPRDTSETVSATLWVLASTGGLLLAIAAVRGLRAVTATRALERRWNAGSAMWNGDASLPVRVIAETVPTVAVVGLVAPRLYISRRVLAECSPAELRAMFAHEASHVASRDNLKRFVMRICPDAVWVRAAIERAWGYASEEAADAAAVSTCPSERLELAQALIRVARLAPTAAPVASPISAFYLGGSIDARVRRLLEPGNEPSRSRLWVCISIVVALSVSAALVAMAPALHQAMETLVRILP